MYKKSLLYISLGILAVIGSISVGLAQERVKPTGEVKVINITDQALNPKEVKVTPGTTVVWANSASAHVHIYFEEGSKVSLACTAPTRFALNDQGWYSSGFTPPGGVASLCFIDEGTFEFKVVNIGSGQQPKPVLAGKVVVARG